MSKKSVSKKRGVKKMASHDKQQQEASPQSQQETPATPQTNAPGGTPTSSPSESSKQPQPQMAVEAILPPWDALSPQLRQQIVKKAETQAAVPQDKAAQQVQDQLFGKYKFIVQLQGSYYAYEGICQRQGCGWHTMGIDEQSVTDLLKAHVMQHWRDAVVKTYPVVQVTAAQTGDPATGTISAGKAPVPPGTPPPPQQAPSKTA